MGDYIQKMSLRRVIFADRKIAEHAPRLAVLDPVAFGLQGCLL